MTFAEILIFIAIYIFAMITGIAIGRLAGFERINDLEEQNQDLSSMFKTQQDTIQELQLKLNERTTELEDGKKRWAYFRKQICRMQHL